MRRFPNFLLIVNAILAIGLTVLSLQYIQPKNCYNFCDPSYVIPCPKGSCYFGDQKAGWPLPVFIDSPGGGSPTGGWGFLGPEDPPSPFTMLGDVLFYSILAWIVIYIIQFFRGQVVPPKLFPKSLLLNALFAVGLWLVYFIFGFTMYFHMIGRGHRDYVHVEKTSDIDLQTASGFVPTVYVPLDEVIEYYGEPDSVWFTSDSTTEVRTIGVLLYWNSVKLFVELPQIKGKTYPVHRKTSIERVIFFDDQDVIVWAGKPISEEKAAWRGYGDYQP